MVASFAEKLTYTYQRVADAKTELLVKKGVAPLQKALDNALASGNEYMANTIQTRIENFQIEPVVAKTVTDIDIARAYIDTLTTARPVANFFGGDILEPVFSWLYYAGLGRIILVINLRPAFIAVWWFGLSYLWLVMFYYCTKRVTGFIQLVVI